MRTPLFFALLALAGCAGPLPQADPQQAWVSLYASAGYTLIAHKLDDKQTRDGRYFQVDGAIVRPLPVQTEGIPLWIAGGGEKVTLRIAAQYGSTPCNRQDVNR